MWIYWLLMGGLALTEALNFPDQNATCPATSTKTGDCKDGWQEVAMEYYKVTPYGKCVRHFTEEKTPCGGKKHCPHVRIVSQDACKGGFAKTMVIRYVWNDASLHCDRKFYHIALPCGDEINEFLKPHPAHHHKHGSEKPDGPICPNPVHFEEECDLTTRPVFAITFHRHEDKCLRHVTLEAEPCGTFDQGGKCSQSVMISKGPCDAEHNQYVLSREFYRNEQGMCLGKDSISYQQCVPQEDCPPEQIVDAYFDRCQDGEKRILVRKFHHKDNGECKPEALIRFEPCGPSYHGVCPTKRYMNFGHCKPNGFFDVDVIHYKVDNDGICRRKEHTFEKPCAERKDYHSDEGCPKPEYSEDSCVQGIKEVMRKYYTKHRVQLKNQKPEERCILHKELTREACKLTDPTQQCPYATSVERTPCKDGQMTISRHFYEEDEHGCHQKVTRTHHAC